MNEKNSGNSSTDIAKRLKKLIEANQSLADLESLADLLPRLLDLARDVTAAEAASILLYNPAREILEFICVKDEIVGDETEEILKSSIELKMGEGIAGWVALNRIPVIIDDVQNDERFFRDADQCTGFVTRTLLCVPLLYGSDLLGVIEVLNSKGKPRFEAEDKELLESFANLAVVAIIRSRLIEARLMEQKLQVQLETASKIQTLFWPKIPTLPAGSHVWAVSIPAAFVGGDVYDVIPMPDGSWLFYVADVSGKGLPGALIMAALSSRIRSEALLHSEVDQLLESVNNAMCDLLAEESFFATIVIARYWPEIGRMQLAGAGHLPPLWSVREGFGEVPDLRGIPLGILPGSEYSRSEILLSPGQSILFITDGVTEARNARGELFGYQRLEEYVASASGPPCSQGLLDLLRGWRRDADENDDLTVLEIWRDPERPH